MVNKVTLIGHLGKDPEIRRFENNSGTVGRFSVATKESYKDKEGNWQEQTEWHDVIVWNEKAEHAEKYFKKGSLVYIEGKLTHRKYVDAQNTERSVTEVMASVCRFLREPGQGTAYQKAALPTEVPTQVAAQTTVPKSPASVSTFNTSPSPAASSTATVTTAEGDDLPF